MFPLKSGTKCRFRLSDVICPDRKQVIDQITPELEVAGEIVLFSDGGTEPEQYAIIEVEGIGAPLIVPVTRLQSSEAGTKAAGQSQAPATVDTQYENVGKS